MVVLENKNDQTNNQPARRCYASSIAGGQLAINHSRFAVIISAKALKRAVDRNKIKRRFYSIIRQHIRYLQGGYNVVFLVKKISFYANYKSIATEIYNIFKTAGLFTKGH